MSILKIMCLGFPIGTGWIVFYTDAVINRCFPYTSMYLMISVLQLYK